MRTAGNPWLSGEFRISVQNVVLMTLLFIYRDLGEKRYRFSVKSLFDGANSSRDRSKSAFFFRNENFAFAGVIGLAHDTFLFHPLHQ